MKIGILGSGIVGRTLGSKLVSLGHDVRMGSRTATNAEAAAWVAAAGAHASQGTFADAAAFGELAIHCTSGAHAVDAVSSTGSALDGKILIEVSNALDFSKGMPPSLLVCNTDSLAEQIQRALPRAKVVKSLNTMNCSVMVDPKRVPGHHDVFVAGNDAIARQTVAGHLTEWFGWTSPVDLGDITAARGLEMWLPLWVRLAGTLKTSDFNLSIVRA